MNSAIAALIVSLAVGSAPSSADGDYRVYVGSTAAQVDTGTVWLFMYSWNGSEQAAVGLISNGAVHIHFDHHSMYLLDEAHRADGNHDDHYKFLIELPDQQWYVTRTIKYRELFRRWRQAIDGLGRTRVAPDGTTILLLPAPSMRTITLLRANGSPAANMSVDLALHISDANHCGVEEGPSLGRYKTDRSGTFTIVEPPSLLYLGAPYVRGVESHWVQFDTIIASQRHVTVRRAWGLPPRASWRVALRGLDGFPIAGADVSGYEEIGCGGAFEFLTDRAGVARTRFIPQVLGWVSVTATGGSRFLTDEERARVARTGELKLDWPSPGGDVPPDCAVSVVAFLIPCWINEWESP